MKIKNSPNQNLFLSLIYIFDTNKKLTDESLDKDTYNNPRKTKLLSNNKRAIPWNQMTVFNYHVNLHESNNLLY